MATTYTIDSEVSFVAITYLFGNLFAMCFGSALSAAAAFYLATTEDRPVFKRVVGAALAFEIVHVVLAFVDTARTFGNYFGVVDVVYALSPLYVAGMIVGACTALTVQTFYAWRCMKLLNSKIVLPIILGLFILFCFSSMFAANLIAYMSDDPALFMTNGPTLEAFIYLRLPYIAAISIDAMLCALTLFALYKAQAMGSAQGVGKVVKRLVILTITSNALTTSFCILLLIVSVRYNGAFWALTLCASDFYMFTLLVWLYQRRASPEIRRGSGSDGSGSSGDSDRPLRPANAAYSFPSPNGSPKKSGHLAGGIHVTSTTAIYKSEQRRPSDDDIFSDKDLV